MPSVPAFSSSPPPSPPGLLLPPPPALCLERRLRGRGGRLKKEKRKSMKFVLVLSGAPENVTRLLSSDECHLFLCYISIWSSSKMTISINLNSEAGDELYLSAHFGCYMDMSSYFLTGMSSSSKKNKKMIFQMF